MVLSGRKSFTSLLDPRREMTVLRMRPRHSRSRQLPSVAPRCAPWPSSENENDGLCDECTKLDLEQSFARAFALYEGARRGRNTRTLEVYRSDDGPAYLGHFYYVTSLGDGLSRV